MQVSFLGLFISIIKMYRLILLRAYDLRLWGVDSGQRDAAVHNELNVLLSDIRKIAS